KGQLVRGCQRCYICRMRAVFHELHRVLRDDGTVWLNVGDGFSGRGGVGRQSNPKACSDVYAPRTHMRERHRDQEGKVGRPVRRELVTGGKLKDLYLVPQRLALALQADGWYIRGDGIWEKQNSIPESCDDRPTRTHEYLW